MSEPLNFVGKELSPVIERKIVLLGSVVGILGVLFIYYKSNHTTNTPVQSAGLSPNNSGGYSGSGGGTTGNTSGLPPQGTNVEFKFNTDTSNSLIDQINGVYGNSSTSDSTGSGSGGLSLFGFSIGGGGSKSNTGSSTSQSSTSNTLNSGNSNIFSTDVSLQNASDSTISGVESFLTNLAGTQAERSAQSIKQQQSVFPYVSGNTAINTGQDRGLGRR